MKPQKMGKLLATAAREPAPAPAPGFDARVLRALRRELARVPPGLLDQLSALFPRVAVATVVVISLLLAADLCLSHFVQRDLSAGVLEASEQWLFAAR